jgi:hypothetical protein
MSEGPLLVGDLDLTEIREGHTVRSGDPTRCMCGSLVPCETVRLADEVERLLHLAEAAERVNVRLAQKVMDLTAAIHTARAAERADVCAYLLTHAYPGLAQRIAHCIHTGGEPR